MHLHVGERTSGAAGPLMDMIDKTPGGVSSRRNPIGFLNQSEHGLCAVKNVQTASSPNLQVSEPKTTPRHSKETQLAENAAPALDHTVPNNFYFRSESWCYAMELSL